MMSTELFQPEYVAAGLSLLNSLVPADVAPPGSVLILSLGGLLLLGLFIAIVVFVSFLVIRGIKKGRTSRDDL